MNEKRLNAKKSTLLKGELTSNLMEVMTKNQKKEVSNINIFTTDIIALQIDLNNCLKGLHYQVNTYDCYNESLYYTALMSFVF